MEEQVDDEVLMSWFAPEQIDCHSWISLYHAALGMYLDFCAVCSRPRREHPEDSFGDDD